MFRVLDWENEASQAGLLSKALNCRKLLHSRSCWKEINLLEADLVWKEGLVKV